MLRNISLIAIFFVTCTFSNQVMAEDAIKKRLEDSIWQFDVLGVKEALTEGADPNGDGGRLSPLKRAAVNASRANTRDKENALTSIVESLFQYGAKLTDRDNDILMNPIYYGLSELVRLLLENDANQLRPIQGQFPIAIAEGAKQSNIVDLLIEFGVAPLSKREILQIKLVSSVEDGDVDGVKAALSAGAKINEPALGNRYALTSIMPFAYMDDHWVEMVAFLLSNNANPNILGDTFGTHTTPLTCIFSNLAYGKAIEENKPQSNMARRNLLRVISLLVKHEVDTELRDGSGKAPLHIAAEKDYFFAVKKLIELGADIGVLDSRGRTPFELAESEAVKNLLKQEVKKQAKYDENNFDKGSQALIEANYQEALALLQPFAEVGDVKAQAGIGTIYLFGRNGVKKDYQKAGKWLRKASVRGDMLAQLLLSHIYSNGLGVKRDLVKATKLYLRAAEQGNANAQVKLAHMYNDGKGGLEVNKVKATNLYQLAAEGGNVKAQLYFGIKLWYGTGITQDYEKALIWYRKVATQGGKERQAACNFIGDAYRRGLGVSKDNFEAVKWYRLAAEQGHPESQRMLGAYYQLGKGVPEDNVLAYMWANLAAAQGNQNAEKLRDAIGEGLSKNQLAEAQRMTRQWRPNGSKAAEKNETTKESRKEKKLSGTGFFISKEGRVLTNYHVVKGCKELSVQMPSGYKSAASVATKDERDDLAILATEKMTDSVAQFRVGASPQVGEQVVIYGFPLAGILSSSGNLVTGNLSALAGLRNNPRHYQITAPVQPGNSGGSLLDESGRVIGVIVSKLDAAKFAEATGDIPQNINFAIKGSTALNFIEANGVKPQFTMKSDKLTTAQIAKKAEGYTVQVICSK